MLTVIIFHAIVEAGCIHHTVTGQRNLNQDVRHPEIPSFSAEEPILWVFTSLYPDIPKDSIREVKDPGIFLKRDSSDNACEDFDLSTVKRNIYKCRTAINQPQKRTNKKGRGVCIDQRLQCVN